MSPREGTGPGRPKRPAPAKPPVVGVEKVTCASHSPAAMAAASRASARMGRRSNARPA
jgi:hypothetical protein